MVRRALWVGVVVEKRDGIGVGVGRMDEIGMMRMGMVGIGAGG